MEIRPEPTFEITQLANSSAAFGVLVDYLANIEPFSRYDFGNFAHALEHQLQRQCHVAALSAGKLVGYCGWLSVTNEMAIAWVEGRGRLLPGDSAADAVVLTVVAAPNRAVLMAMIGRARDLNPSRRVHFKRQYTDKRPARKASVENARP